MLGLQLLQKSHNIKIAFFNFLPFFKESEHFLKYYVMIITNSTGILYIKKNKKSSVS